jgi:hypothetical protein
MMAYAIRSLRRWQTWFTRALVLLLALLLTLVGPAPAHAYQQDDDDDNEVVTSGPNVCTTTANLPPYPNATCIEHETELDDGGTEVENSYQTPDAVDIVRRAYEAAFSQNGWTLVATEEDQADQEWEYTITREQRRVKVTIEAHLDASGSATQIEIKEVL